MTSKAEYLQFIEKAYVREKEHALQEYERELQKAHEATPLFGYLPPRSMLDFGATCAFLYALKREEQLAEQAKRALLFYQDWRKQLPEGAEQSRPEYEEGIPPMEPVFQPILFVPAVQNIRDTLSEEDLRVMSNLLADTFRTVWRFPEWGSSS